MMEEANSTLVIVMLIVGLVVGTGAGYMLAPAEDTDEVATPTTETIHSYEPSIVSWLALIISIFSLIASGGLWYMIVGSKQ